MRARGRFDHSHHEIGEPLGGVGDRGAARGLRPPLQDCHVGGQLGQTMGEPLRRKIGLPDDLRGPDCGEMGGIGGLVLIERKGERHEDRRPSDDREFRNGRGAGARDDEMGAGHARRQIGEKGRDIGDDLQSRIDIAHACLVFAADLLDEI